MVKEEETEPEMGPFLFYVEAFRELSSCRHSGMSLGPIPFTAIAEYSRLYDVGDFEEFHYLIRAMDYIVLKLESERTKQTESKK